MQDMLCAACHEELAHCVCTNTLGTRRRVLERYKFSPTAVFVCSLVFPLLRILPKSFWSWVFRVTRMRDESGSAQ